MVQNLVIPKHMLHDGTVNDKSLRRGHCPASGRFHQMLMRVSDVFHSPPREGICSRLLTPAGPTMRLQWVSLLLPTYWRRASHLQPNQQGACSPGEQRNKEFLGWQTGATNRQPMKGSRYPDTLSTLSFWQWAQQAESPLSLPPSLVSQVSKNQVPWL